MEQWGLLAGWFLGWKEGREALDFQADCFCHRELNKKGVTKPSLAWPSEAELHLRTVLGNAPRTRHNSSTSQIPVPPLTEYSCPHLLFSDLLGCQVGFKLPPFCQASSRTISMVKDLPDPVSFWVWISQLPVDPFLSRDRHHCIKEFCTKSCLFLKVTGFMLKNQGIQFS